MAIKINYNQKDFIKENENNFTVKFWIKEIDTGNKHKFELLVDKQEMYSLYVQDDSFATGPTGDDSFATGPTGDDIISTDECTADWISSLVSYSRECDINFFTMLCVYEYINQYDEIVFNIPAVGGYTIVLTYNENESLHRIDSLIQADY